MTEIDKVELDGNEIGEILPATPPKKTKRSSRLTVKRWLFGSLVILLVLAGLSLFITELYLRKIQPQDLVLPTPVAGETLNILLIGTDAGLLDGGGTMPSRSDVLMLFSFDPKTKETAVISIPRDTFVYLEGVGYNRVNAAHVYGGTEMTLDTVEELIDAPIHYYAKINFRGFKTLIDTIGGVPLMVEEDMYYSDPYDVPPLLVDLKAGYQILDGNKAEQYVRFRSFDGDIGRVERQQKFMASLMKQLLKPTILLRAPLSAIRLQPYLETNMHTNHGIQFVSKYFLGKEPYHMTLPGTGEYIDGASYWISDDWTLKELWQQLQEKGTE